MERENRVGEDNGYGMILYTNQRRFDGGTAGGGYKVTRNPLGTVPNKPLASAPGKELHPQILSMLAMHGGQVKREKRSDDLAPDIPVGIDSRWVIY